MSTSHLWSLSDVIFRDILHKVDSGDIYRLYLSGCSRVQVRLCHGVEEFSVGVSRGSNLIFWPPILRQWLKLNALVVDYLMRDPSSYFLSETLPLGLLPHQLQKLELRGDLSLFSAFLGGEEEVSPCRNSFKNLVPHLRVLKAIRQGKECTELPHLWDHLPSCIEELSLCGIASGLLPPLASTFPALQSLEIHSFKLEKGHSSFPASLTSLMVEMEPEFFVDFMRPQSDDSLGQETYSNIPSTSSAFAFPCSLTSLAIIPWSMTPLSEYFPLPSTLIKLHFDPTEEYDASFIRQLPRGLTDLELSVAPAIPSTTPGELKSFEELFLALPRGLKRLNLDLRFSNRSTWLLEELEALPKSLLQVPLLQEMDFPEDPSVEGERLPIGSILPHLAYFSFDRRSFGLRQLMSSAMPSNSNKLKDLCFSNVRRENAFILARKLRSNLSLESIHNFPLHLFQLGLNDLSRTDINLPRFSVPISEDESLSTALVDPGSFMFWDPAICGEGKRTSVFRLDLALPRKLKHLGMDIHWYSNAEPREHSRRVEQRKVLMLFGPLNPDDLPPVQKAVNVPIETNQEVSSLPQRLARPAFEVQWEPLNWNDGGLREMVAAGCPISTTSLSHASQQTLSSSFQSDPHFKCLESLKMREFLPAWVTLLALPPTLTSIDIMKFSSKSLKDAIPYPPRGLRVLKIDSVSRIEAGDWDHLPNGLTELVVMCAQPELCSYTVDDLKRLPQSLVHLELPMGEITQKGIDGETDLARFLPTGLVSFCVHGTGWSANFSQWSKDVENRLRRREEATMEQQAKLLGL